MTALKLHHRNWCQWIPDTPDDYRLFALTLTDWIGYLIGEPMILFAYGTSLQHVLSEHLSGTNREHLELIGKDRLQSYLARAYLVRYALSLEIHPSGISDEWAMIVLSTLYYPPHFHSLSLPLLDNDHPLNRVRSQQQAFRLLVEQLLNRDDITDARKDVDHGLLLSLSFAYGLRLAEASLTHGSVVTDDKTLLQFTESVSSLSLLFQRNWQCQESMVPR